MSRKQEGHVDPKQGNGIQVSRTVVARYEELEAEKVVDHGFAFKWYHRLGPPQNPVDERQEGGLVQCRRLEGRRRRWQRRMDCDRGGTAADSAGTIGEDDLIFVAAHGNGQAVQHQRSVCGAADVGECRTAVAADLPLLRGWQKADGRRRDTVSIRKSGCERPKKVEPWDGPSFIGPPYGSPGDQSSRFGRYFDFSGGGGVSLFFRPRSRDRTGDAAARFRAAS